MQSEAHRRRHRVILLTIAAFQNTRPIYHLVRSAAIDRATVMEGSSCVNHFGCRRLAYASATPPMLSSANYWSCSKPVGPPTRFWWFHGCSLGAVCCFVCIDVHRHRCAQAAQVCHSVSLCIFHFSSNKVRPADCLGASHSRLQDSGTYRFGTPAHGCESLCSSCQGLLPAGRGPSMHHSADYERSTSSNRRQIFKGVPLMTSQATGRSTLDPNHRSGGS